MRRKKGFTLMELTIVLAIIGILLAIIVPSWGYYLERSRLKSQNNKARIVFNAAQNIVTDLEFSERAYLTRYEAAMSEELSTKQAIAAHFYTPNPAHDTVLPDPTNEWYFYWDGTTASILDNDGATINSTADGYNYKGDIIDTWNGKMLRSINKIVGDETIYKVYVRDYTVLAVISARDNHDVYIGSYPVTLDHYRGSMGRDWVNDIRADHLEGMSNETIAMLTH